MPRSRQSLGAGSAFYSSVAPTSEWSGVGIYPTGLRYRMTGLIVGSGWGSWKANELNGSPARHAVWVHGMPTPAADEFTYTLAGQSRDQRELGEMRLEVCERQVRIRDYWQSPCRLGVLWSRRVADQIGQIDALRRRIC